VYQALSAKVLVTDVSKELEIQGLKLLVYEALVLLVYEALNAGDGCE
jgi:hypothetical protein